MAKVNYQYEKRQKEIQKKRKKDQKEKEKQKKKNVPGQGMQSIPEAPPVATPPSSQPVEN